MSEELAARHEGMDRLIAERDKLQAFKDWTHQFLDAHGVPHHPPGTHGAEGCRIGDRMDWLMVMADDLRRQRDDLVTVCRLLLARLEIEGTGAKETWHAIDVARDLLPRCTP